MRPLPLGPHFDHRKLRPRFWRLILRQDMAQKVQHLLSSGEILKAPRRLRVRANGDSVTQFRRAHSVCVCWPLFRPFLFVFLQNSSVRVASTSELDREAEKEGGKWLSWKDERPRHGPLSSNWAWRT